VARWTTDVSTIARKRNRDGSTSYVAQVRIQPFKPVAKSFPTKAEAKSWADRHERELKDHRTDSKVTADLPRLTIAQLVLQFLDDPNTQKLRYYDDLETLLCWWVEQYGSERVLALGAATLREARGKLLVGRAHGTVNRYLSALRSCWNWGRAAEIIPQKLVWPTRLMLREPKGRVRYLDDAELAALLKAAAEHSAMMHAAILVSIATGVRMSELRRLKWADIDFARKRLRVMLSKNNESRAGHLPESAVAVLKALKGNAKEDKHVLVDADGNGVKVDWVEYRWGAIREKAGLQDFRFHDLRHSTASLLAQNGASLPEIGAVLGHKSASATQRYAHLVEGAPVTGHTKLDEKLKAKPA
jgi:integrase